MSHKVLYGINIALTLVFGFGFLFVATDGWNAFTAEAARRYSIRSNPRAVPEVHLQNISKDNLTFDDFRGYFILVDFIYTGCASACTSLGMTFNKIQSTLQKKHIDKNVVLLSISFDLERDGITQLKSYANRFGANKNRWYITRPMSKTDLNILLEQFEVVVIPKNQLFVHNTAIYLINPEGKLTQIFELNQTETIINHIQSRL